MLIRFFFLFNPSRLPEYKHRLPLLPFGYGNFVLFQKHVHLAEPCRLNLYYWLDSYSHAIVPCLNQHTFSWKKLAAIIQVPF